MEREKIVTYGVSGLMAIVLVLVVIGVVRCCADRHSAGEEQVEQQTEEGRLVAYPGQDIRLPA